jgi:hypothetical protein
VVNPKDSDFCKIGIRGHQNHAIRPKHQAPLNEIHQNAAGPDRTSRQHSSGQRKPDQSVVEARSEESCKVREVLARRISACK